MALGAHRSATRTTSPSMTDKARFEQIYDDYSGLILAYAARRTGNIEDATDVVAETFTVAWRRISDVPPGEQARPWLYGVARRTLGNQRRTIGRRSRLDKKLRSEASSFVVDPAEMEPERASTHAVLARMSDGDRELLTLSAWDGLDSNDLARVLGCSPATARVRLHRARRRFERKYFDGGNE